MPDLQRRPIHIILVEDNESDVLLTKRAFAKSKVPNQIHVASTAKAALAMARREGEYSTLPIVDLILLDIDLPDQSGIDVLRQLKENEALVQIPVIALSGQESQEVIEEIYNFKGSSFIAKPSTMEEFNEIVQVVEMCWFRAIMRMREKVKMSKTKYSVRALRPIQSKFS